MFPAVADVLIDAASVLGGDSTLKILYTKLFEVCSNLFDDVKILSIWQSYVENFV